MSPSGKRQRPDENRRQSVTMRSGKAGASVETSNAEFIS
jgi:hypothetical protein